MLSVADQIFKNLKNLGYDFIAGIPGDSNLPLIDAIRKNRMRFILTRHEATAAFMASSYGKMTSKAGLCVSIAGPGATNLITGLMDAVKDRSPVLAFLGQVPELYLGSESFQEINEISLFSSFCNYVNILANPKQANYAFLMALKHSIVDCSVSALSCPTDVLAKEAVPFKIDNSFLEYEKMEASNSSVEKAKKLIDESERPAILIGWGARNSGELALKLAEKIGAVIVTTSRAKGSVSEKNKLVLGVLGSIGSEKAAKAIKNCDLLIILGSSFRQASILPRNAKKIHVDLDANKINKIYKADLSIVADVNSFLKKCIPRVKEKERCDLFCDIIKLDKPLSFKKKPSLLHPYDVVKAVEQFSDKDAVISVDVGDHTYWFYSYFKTDNQKFFLSANLASMGFALPSSISAKLAFPNKQSIAVCGDGGFSMYMAELSTIVRESLDVKIIVFNDGRLKNIYKEQKAAGYKPFGIYFPNPNFAEFARSLSFYAKRVYNKKDLYDAVEIAFKRKGPALIEAMVDPDAIKKAVKHI